MQYECNKCGTTCKGNDGRMLHALPPHYRMAYPVDPRFAVQKLSHLSRPLSRTVQKLMVTHGNGEQLSKMIHQTRGEWYEDIEESYYSQCVDTGSCAGRLPTFAECIGTYSPTPHEIRLFYKKAAESELTTTGISDNNRHKREIQSVSCQVSTASDHTFAALRNYKKTDLKGAQGIYTQNNENGEVAVAVIVPSLALSDHAHASEHFARRPNVNPRVHSSDTYPNFERFWKAIFGAQLDCRLGLWHFINRLYRTLRKNHVDFGTAVTALQECVTYDDTEDKNNVILALRKGTLGRRVHSNAEIMSMKADDKQKWTKYSKYIRRWINPQPIIVDNL
jgi:hypothetical protein